MTCFSLILFNDTLTRGIDFYPHHPDLDASSSALIVSLLGFFYCSLVFTNNFKFALHGKGSFQNIVYLHSICPPTILLLKIAIFGQSTTIILMVLFVLPIQLTFFDLLRACYVPVASNSN